MTRTTAVLRNCVWIAALGGMAISAQATPYTFSFSASSGTVTGTVSGTVDLPFVTLGGTGSGSADSLVLTTFPAGFGTLTGGDTATSWADQVDNSFTVVAGVITQVNFFAATGGSDPSDVLCINNSGTSGAVGTFGCPSGDNELHVSTPLYGFNLDGLPGITFTPTTAGVPEPGTIALLGVGLVGILGISRRKRTSR